MSAAIEPGALFGTLVFLRPWALLVLPPALWLLWRLWRATAADGGAWSQQVDPPLRAHVIGTRRARRGYAGVALAACALVLGVLALAGLARPLAPDIAWRADAARVVVLDLSPAMAAGEPAAAPIERARLKLLDLLATLPGGHTALVVYADEPYLVVPLTTDAATIALHVPELAPEVMPHAGDQPGRALRMAADVLARSGATARDVLWVTAAPDPAAVLDAVAVAGARVSVLHLAGVTDSRTHAAIAARGGVYLQAQAARDDVLALAAMLGAGQRYVADDAHAARTARELGPWLVALMLPIAACAFRRGMLLSVVLALFVTLPAPDAVAGSSVWANADQRGRLLLDAGEAEGAARTFNDPRWRAVALYRAGHYAEAAAVLAPFDDAGSHYNRGNALARIGQLEQARDAYTAALDLSPDDADIAHNLALVRKLLEQQNPPPQAPPEPDAEADEDAELPPDTDAEVEPPASTTAGAPGKAQSSPSGAAGEAESTPAASARTLPRGRAEPEREAAQLAEQWLRRVPDEPAGLLRRKLLLEHERRRSAAVEPPWQ